MLKACNNNRRLGAGLSLLLLASLSWQALAQEQADTAVSQPVAVTAAIPSNFPPQYTLDADGRPTGFGIDLMEEIAGLAGIEVEYRVYPYWIDATSALAAGEVDIIPNMGITEDRLAYTDFTSPLETFTVSIFVRSDSFGISSLQDLSAQPIGVVQNNVAVRLFEQRKQPIVQYPDSPTALFELLSGHVDAIAYPEPVLWRIAQQIGVEDRIRVLTPPLKEIKRAVGVGKGNSFLLDRLETAVASFVGTPEYEAIYTRWYARPSPYWTATRVAWLASFMLGVVILLSFAWRYYSLNRLNQSLELETAKRGQAEEQLTQLNAELEDIVEDRTIELKKRNAVLHTIDQLSSHFIKESDPFVLYPELLEQLLQLTQSEYGFVGDVIKGENGKPILKNYALSNLAWNEETNRLYESYLKTGLEFHDLDNLFGLVITSGKPVISNGPSEDPRRGGMPDGHPAINRFLGIPVFYGEQLVGEIGLANRPGGYDEQMIEELEPVAIALGQIIVARWNREKRVQAERELELLASTDFLTGIANRRKLQDRLAIELNRAKRYGESLSLVMLDIDYFKQVNDQYGHEAGDQVLVQLAQQIQSQIRDVDLLARWGGEEFLILLPETDSETARSLVERVRQHIGAQDFSNPPSITISLGLVTLRDSDDADSLVSRADRALYQAKTTGRNRCVAIA